MGIALERSRIANDLLTTMARVFRPAAGRSCRFGRRGGGVSGRLNRYRRRHRRHDGAVVAADHAAQQILAGTGDRRHFRIGNTRPDHSAIHRDRSSGNPCRRYLCDRTGRPSPCRRLFGCADLSRRGGGAFGRHAVQGGDHSRHLPCRSLCALCVRLCVVEAGKGAGGSLRRR